MPHYNDRDINSELIGASLSEPHIDELHVRNLYIIGASLSEPHIDELNVRNLYIIYIYMVRPSPARRHIHCMQCAIYSGGRMKKLLRSPVPRAQSLLSQQNRLP